MKARFSLLPPYLLGRNCTGTLANVYAAEPEAVLVNNQVSFAVNLHLQSSPYYHLAWGFYM
jgi:hypothetical protein